MTLLPASEEFLSKFPSSRYLSSSGSYPLDLSGVGDPAGRNATAGLALRVTGTHKPLHHDKVEIPMGGRSTYHEIIPYTVLKDRFVGVVVKLQKSTISIVMSVRLFLCISTWKNSAPNEEIFMKFKV
jgi:hypothetical protein